MSCFVFACSVTEVWAALLALNTPCVSWILSAFTAVLSPSTAQHGTALISHQAAIISPSCTHDKYSSSNHTFLLCGTLCGLIECQTHYLFMFAVHGPYCWISVYTVCWLLFELLMSHLCKRNIPYDCKDMRKWWINLVAYGKGSFSQMQVEIKNCITDISVADMMNVPM